MQPTTTDIIAELDRSVGVMTAGLSDTLHTVALVDRDQLWKGTGATCTSMWLAARYAVAASTAREWIRVARALRVLPAITEAYAAGRLSWDQLRPLTRFATAETDAEWAVRARTWRPSSLYREADRHRKVTRREVADARAVRSAAVWWEEGMRLMYLEAVLPAEEGAAVHAALESRAQEILLTDEPESPADARMADALAELVTGGPEDSASEVLVVHADERSLVGDDDPPALAETESGVRLSADAVRRVACAAKVEWVLESDGRPVGIGRRGRTIPPRLHRLVRYRDGGACRFPGCERRRWLKAHHLVHWADGGPTDLDNLVLLCHAHHRLIHEGGWRTSGHPAHELRFHDPGGRPVRSFSERRPELARAS